jgi:hypothetical protein
VDGIIISMSDPYNNPFKKYRKDYKDTGTPVIPVSKIKVTAKPVPHSRQNSEYIRFPKLENSYRFYKDLSYHWKAFIKTAVLSFTLFIVPY